MRKQERAKKEKGNVRESKYDRETDGKKKKRILTYTERVIEYVCVCVCVWIEKERERKG